jgi:[acyl-carrier-protein] S-malonyltransferase
MDTMAERSVDAVVELTPAGTLTGMVKRAIKGTATADLNTPDDFAKAVTTIEEHA